MLSSQNFNSLSLSEKGQIVFSRGTYIADRIYYNQKLVLYAVDNYLVEVYYEPDVNKIHKIEPVKI